MKKILIIFCFLFIVSCGPSQQEKENVAAVTCSIMSETRNMDAAIRVREMNNAREKIGKGPFLRGDEAIKEAFEYGFCKELVLDDSYNEILQPLKDAKRERERIAEENRIAAEKRAAEKRAEEQRIAAEKQRIAAEKQWIAAEKQRIADSKPTVKEEFYSNGKLKSRANYQPKSDGGKKHGLFEVYHENGKLQTKENWKDGEGDGVWEIYYENGQLFRKSNWKDGKEEGLREFFTQNGQLQHAINYKDGKADGLFDTYHNDGKLNERKCYKNGERTDMSYCEK
mgnify:CR=1 FL=1